MGTIFSVQVTLFQDNYSLLFFYNNRAGDLYCYLQPCLAISLCRQVLKVQLERERGSLEEAHLSSLPPPFLLEAISSIRKGKVASLLPGWESGKKSTQSTR